MDKQIDDISINKSHGILKEKDINIRPLPGYGNRGLRKKDIKPYVENNQCSIKINYQHVTSFNIYSVNAL